MLFVLLWARLILFYLFFRCVPALCVSSRYSSLPRRIKQTIYLSLCLIMTDLFAAYRKCDSVSLVVFTALDLIGSDQIGLARLLKWRCNCHACVKHVLQKHCNLAWMEFRSAPSWPAAQCRASRWHFKPRSVDICSIFFFNIWMFLF